MQKTLIPFSQINFLPQLILGYLNGDEKLKPFYKYTPEISSFKKVIEDKSKEKINRKILVDTVTQQYATTSNIKHQISNIQLLLQENTFTVCTGHQLCLFTGPLYFIYKIISTINLAKQLKEAYPAYNFIPVYWMASEDHDFEEINNINIFGKKLEAPPPTPPQREGEQAMKQPAGKISTNTFQTVLSELNTLLSSMEKTREGFESKNTKQLLNLFLDAYLKNKNLADATRSLVNELWGEYGLVIIDANDSQLKKEFAEIMKDDIFNNTNEHLVNSTIQHLDNLSISHQVNPREINCFYMQDNFRERIVFENEKYKVLNSEIEFSRKELQQEIENHPEYFSPNVTLRPLYQEKILPNLAYIGGPAEISYWLEYKSMFEQHKINFPVLMLRNSALWLDTSAVKTMKKLKIKEQDVFQDTEVLIKTVLLQNTEHLLNFEQEEEKLKTLYNEISDKVQSIDETLKYTVEAELQKQLNTLNNIQQKVLKAEKLKQETTVNQIRKIKEKLFPQGKPQERYDNFIPLYLKHGKNFFEMLHENLNPFDFRLVLIEEKALI